MCASLSGACLLIATLFFSHPYSLTQGTSGYKRTCVGLIWSGRERGQNFLTRLRKSCARRPTSHFWRVCRSAFCESHLTELWGRTRAEPTISNKGWMWDAAGKQICAGVKSLRLRWCFSLYQPRTLHVLYVHELRSAETDSGASLKRFSYGCSARKRNLNTYISAASVLFFFLAFCVFVILYRVVAMSILLRLWRETDMT